MLGQFGGKVEGDRVPHLEGRCEVHGGKLAFHRMGNLLAAVTRIHAPEAGGAVKHLVAVDIGVIHAVCRGQQPRCRLELAVRRERHPEIVKNRSIGVSDLIHRRLHCADIDISDFPVSNKPFSL